MSSVRRLMGYVVLGFLMLGYLASQYAYLYGDPERYAKAIDNPQVRLLSLVLFVGAIVLAMYPDREPEP